MIEIWLFNNIVDTWMTLFFLSFAAWGLIASGGLEEMWRKFQLPLNVPESLGPLWFLVRGLQIFTLLFGALTISAWGGFIYVSATYFFNFVFNFSGLWPQIILSILSMYGLSSIGAKSGKNVLKEVKNVEAG